MINDDRLINYSIQQLGNNYIPQQDCGNWVDYTRFLKTQIKYIREGFPGISNSDLQLISSDNLQIGMRIIIDDNLDSNCGNPNTDHAAIMGVIENIDNDNITIIIDGIGQGYDFTRDPDRLLKWRDKYNFNKKNYHCILQVTTKPREDGSSVYYYFNKSTRDYRY